MVIGYSSWSSDGQAMLLPGTFLKSKETSFQTLCCNCGSASDTRTCVEMLAGAKARKRSSSLGHRTSVLKRRQSPGHGNLPQPRRPFCCNHRLSTNGRRYLASCPSEQRRSSSKPSRFRSHRREGFNQPPRLVAQQNKFPESSGTLIPRSRVSNWEKRASTHGRTKKGETGGAGYTNQSTTKWGNGIHWLSRITVSPNLNLGPRGYFQPHSLPEH